MTDDIKAIVAELERLEREASPAPWEAETWSSEDGGYGAVGPMHEREFEQEIDDTFECAEADAKLLASLRNSFPTLLAELRRLWAVEAELAELRTVLRCPASDYDPPTHRCGRCDSEVEP